MWLAHDEFPAAQAAPHFAPPGRAAEPVSECLLIGRIRDVSCERAADQLPPVDAVIFMHGRLRSFDTGTCRSFSAGSEESKRARTAPIQSGPVSEAHLAART